MTDTPTFDDLTPPDDVYHEAAIYKGWRGAATAAARWGARHGWEQARQLWPEPITDRPPTEEDGDEAGQVQVLFADDLWGCFPWKSAAARGHRWQHTPRWQPRQPSLQERAKEQLKRHDLYGEPLDTNLILSALEQAGEGHA
jgi:hypothetical protein